MAKKIGVLTGGGDCPGLNAAIRAIVRRAIDGYGFSVLGIKRGWAGLVDGIVEPLTAYSVSGILPRGGTILGSSRTNPLKSDEKLQRLKDNFKKYGLDALIAIGGEDTIGVASKLFDIGFPVVGLPKTIDNDLGGTDYTFGFDTAVNIVTEAIDRLHTTAEAHDRVIVVEVMGRHAGWIAVYGGLAGGADLILVPEKPYDINEVCELLKKRHKRGKNFSIVVVAEGAKEKDSGLVTKDKKVDAFGHETLGGIGNVLAEQIEKLTGYETRVTVLGHIQRGGTPTPFDRVLATRCGVAAVDLVAKGEFGKMVALQGTKIVPIPLKDAVGNLKTLDDEMYEIAKVFFG